MRIFHILSLQVPKVLNLFDNNNFSLNGFWVKKYSPPLTENLTSKVFILHHLHIVIRFFLFNYYICIYIARNFKYYKILNKKKSIEN